MYPHSTTKRCPKCGIEKPRDAFGKANRRDGLQTYCKECHRVMLRRGAVTTRAIPVADRFWRHVEKTDGCWIWTASKDANGYGRINGGQGHPVLATHVSWELANGPIPEGMGILHRCDNPPCVRPDHLFLGDQAINMQDCAEKGRTTRGERSASAKLTAQQAREIRTRYAQGGISQSALGREYGLCQATIRELIIGETWKHLD